MLEYPNEIARLLSERTLVIKPARSTVCTPNALVLHDAVSGEVLGGQCSVEIRQLPGELATATVTLVVDGRYVRIEGADHGAP